MSERIVYLVQDVPGTQAGTPKINIVGAREYGEIKLVGDSIYERQERMLGHLIRSSQDNLGKQVTLHGSPRKT